MIVIVLGWLCLRFTAAGYLWCQRHLPSNRLVQRLRARPSIRIGVTSAALGAGYFVVGVLCAQGAVTGRAGVAPSRGAGVVVVRAQARE